MFLRIIAVSAFSTFLMVQTPAKAGTLTIETTATTTQEEADLIKLVNRHRIGHTSYKASESPLMASNKQKIFANEYADYGSIVLPKKSGEQYSGR